MENVYVMKCFQTSDNLYEYPPNLVFRDVMLALGARSNLLEEVSAINVLHDYATGGYFLKRATYQRQLESESKNASL